MTNEELIIHDKLRFTSVGLVFAHRYVLDSSWRDDPIPPWDALIYIIRGRISLTIHNKTVLANEGSIITLARFRYHEMHVKRGETAEVIICCFSAAFRDEVSGKRESALEYIRVPDVTAAANRAEAERRFSELVSLDKACSASDIFKRSAKTAELLLWLTELSEARIGESAGGGFDFADTLSFIDRYYCEKNITIDMLARRVSVSSAHFMREFRKKYGISCKRYIQLKRINRALEMLVSSKASVSEISQACMFDNSSYMAELIKRETGMSPTEYRKFGKR